MISSIIQTSPFLVCIICIIVILLRYRKNHKQDTKFLLFLLIDMSIFSLYYCSYISGEINFIKKTYPIFIFSKLTIFPLYYIYIKSITIPKRNKKLEIASLLPAFIFSFLLFILIFPTGIEEFSKYIYQALTSRPKPSDCSLCHYIYYIILCSNIYFTFQILYTTYKGIILIKKYNLEIADYYSDTYNKTFFNIRHSFSLFSLLAILLFMLNIFGMFNFTNNQVIVYIISISLSIFAFSIAYIGENQKFNIIDFEQEKQKEDSTHNDTSLSPQMFRTLSEKIDDIIKKEKLYLNSDLRVSDIATRLNSNRTYIHQAINKERSLSFSEYINHFRIEHSKQLIIDKINKGENPTIQDIIYESGFTNMSSFYRVFKNETGYTPHSWIKQNTK